MKLQITVKTSSGPTLKASADLSDGVADTVLACQVGGYIWSLPDGQYCSRVLDEQSWEQVIPQETAQFLRQTASRAVTAAPNFAFGMDGTTYTVEVTSGFNTALYKWWGEPPVGWEPLAEILREVLRIARIEEVMQIEWLAA